MKENLVKPTEETVGLDTLGKKVTLGEISKRIAIDAKIEFYRQIAKDLDAARNSKLASGWWELYFKAEKEREALLTPEWYGYL